MGEEVSGIENFKQWVTEDLSAFPDMKITILDDLITAIDLGRFQV